MTLKFQIFYNGQEKYDNYIITYDENTKKWSSEKTTYNTGIFGNFWPHKKYRNDQQNLELKVKINNKEYTFSSSEVAFQASKCKNDEDINKFTCYNFHSGDSFRLGRKVELIENWDKIKIDVMLNILECKFMQYENLKNILLSTDDALLIEHTPIKGKDTFWADDNDGTGKNNLGIALMKTRVKLGGVKSNPKCMEKIDELYEFVKNMEK